MALTPFQQASLMKKFITQQKPGVTSKQTSKITQTITTGGGKPAMKSSTPPPPPKSSGYSGGGSGGGYTAPPPKTVETIPVEEKPVELTDEQQQVQDTIDSLKDKEVKVTYRTPEGYTKSYVTRGFDPNKIPGEFVDVRIADPRGGYTQRILVSGGLGFYETSREEYREGGKIPNWYREQIEIPMDVKYLGLEQEYLRYGYEETIGIRASEEKVNKLIEPFVKNSTLARWFYHKYKPTTFKYKVEQKFKKLPVSRKFEYGLKFGELGDKPIGEYKYYEGGVEYLKENKEKAITKFIESRGGYGKFYEKSDIDPIEIAQKYGSEGGVYGGGKVTSEKFIREYSWDVLTKTPSVRKETYYSRYSLPVRAYTSFYHSFIGATLFPVTLPQSIYKFVTGTQTLGAWDVANTLGSTRLGPTGAIGTIASEGIGYLTGNDSQEWETTQKYPIESFFATIGEIAGIYIGGKMVNIGKVSAIKGFGKIRSFAATKGISLPSYTSFARYSPTNLSRTIYYKYLERTGKVTFIRPEQVLNPKSIPYDLSYAPGGSSSTRIANMIKSFENTRVSNTLTGVHTTTHSWFKPVVKLFKGRESPGVSFAPFGKGSSRFLRLGANTDYATGVSIFPKINLRTAPLLRFNRITRIPKNLANSYNSANRFILDTGTGVYVAPKMYLGGGEYEVIARGWAIRQGVRYYTRVEGITVPLPEFTLSGHLPSFGSDILSGIKSIVSPFSYTSGSSISIVNPKYIFSKFFGSSFNSRASSPISSSFSSSNFGYLSSIPKSISSNVSNMSSIKIPISSSISKSSSSSINSYIKSVSSSLSSRTSSPSNVSSDITSPQSSIKSISSNYGSSGSSSSSSSYLYSNVKYDFPKLPNIRPNNIEEKPMFKIKNKGYRFRSWKIPTFKQFMNTGW